FWTDVQNYEAYYEIEKSKPKIEFDFFRPDEIEFLYKWANVVYDKNNLEHFSAKEKIMDTLGNKTKFWSNQIVKRIPGLETSNSRRWNQIGSISTPDGRATVTKFKAYTWARIYRTGHDKKHIFFTVGVDGESKELLYKLDYHYESSSTLNDEQKAIIKQNIPQELSWKAIPISELDNFDWDSLLEVSFKFISSNLETYDRLIELAWGEREPKEVISNSIKKGYFPAKGYDEIPHNEANFEDVKVDFIQEQIENTELGDAGEALVIEFEKKRLGELGLHDLSEKVRKVLDGEGYDILSFDENGESKYIEVKTTPGDSRTPFYYTQNEKAFALQNPDNYIIYRLYNYDKEKNTADMFEIKDLNQVLFEPVVFKVYPKNKKQ
ncbi:MAG: DUF3883 domain-containing protein, partial [Saprospiraceae bacterium]|nr:DUF3883 domain-containing protein [Saprospiraceae bacterium]